MTLWNYGEGEAVRGPVDDATIRGLLIDQKLKVYSAIQNDETKEWISVDVSEFASLATSLSGLRAASRPTREGRGWPSMTVWLPLVGALAGWFGYAYATNPSLRALFAKRDLSCSSAYTLEHFKVTFTTSSFARAGHVQLLRVEPFQNSSGSDWPCRSRMLTTDGMWRNVYLRWEKLGSEDFLRSQWDAIGTTTR
ncbi:MAG: hypothetical protein JNK84_14445 [Phreatobacter sp.]|uniref:hypothetical protein n=1 Tax=Phreatobacter sp. TaxID=1966341 RepID=UPI001A48BD10|nr:hypothetical protein [Phreatobacter sp.]MBL8570265.1 hypothetical protein [Phreatobacter sp.]